MSETPYNPVHERDRLRKEVLMLGTVMAKRAWELCRMDAQMREVHIDLDMQQAAKWGIDNAIVVFLDYLRTAEFVLVPMEAVVRDQPSYGPKPYPHLKGNLMPPEEPLTDPNPDGPPEPADATE